MRYSHGTYKTKFQNDLETYSFLISSLDHFAFDYMQIVE